MAAFNYEGVYKLVNQHSKTVLDVREKGAKAKAGGYAYVGFDSQKWEVTNTDGMLWHLQCVANKRYLGVEADQHASEALRVGLVDHRFAWSLRRVPEAKDEACVRLCVPYTPFALDLDEHKKDNPGTVVQLCPTRNVVCQRWVLSRDLESAVVSEIQNEGVYQIVGAFDNKVVEIEGPGKKATGSSRTRSDTQHFQAIHSSAGWAFRSVASNIYLGVPHKVESLANNTSVAGVPHEVWWTPVADSKDATTFRLWIPYTGKKLSLNDKNQITVSDQDGRSQLWRFEKGEKDLASPPTEKAQ